MANEFYNLKQTIWNNKLLTALKKILIFGNLANRNYEGEARRGGTVKISQIGEVAVNDYTAYSDMTRESLDDNQLTLRIDQQKYIAFQLDQTDTTFIPFDLVNAGLDRGIYRVRDTIDQFIAGKYTEAGVTYGSATSPAQSSSGTIVQHMAELYEAMSEANIPLENRWAVLRPWMFTKLFLAGVSQQYPNSDLFREGYIGGIAGFSRLYMSMNSTAVNTTTTTVIASSGLDAITFASAIDGDIRVLPAEARRATNVDALFVYGAKVVRPDMLACGYFSEVAN